VLLGVSRGKVMKKKEIGVLACGGVSVKTPRRERGSRQIRGLVEEKKKVGLSAVKPRGGVPKDHS